jgi:S1-C subfamily serine protease
MTAQTNAPAGLMSFSNEITGIVERASASVVRVEDGSRLTATGVVWSEDGVVGTTSLGVERDEDLFIEQPNGTLSPASLVGRDPDTDIAVLKAEKISLPGIPHAAEADVKNGNLVLALARPGRAGLHATLGIISSKTDTQNGGKAEYILHTDADLYPGFSGGPLVDMEGRIVGLTNLMFGRGKGIALGTPIIAHITEALLANGRIQRGYLGIRTQQVTLPEGLRDSLQLEQLHALLIAQVESGSPAEQGGLMLGDTLLAFQDTTISDVEALRRQLRLNRAGAEIKLSILRGGKIEEITITLGLEQ